MPIRINLLAEQQAAEEARRRDPVKRALWVCSGLAALMVVWMISLQVQSTNARAELSRFEAKLQSVEDNSKEARREWTTSHELESRMASLRRYSSSRFYCATALDALQQVMPEDVRVVRLQSVHTYSTNAESAFKTNVVFPVQSDSTWQFWKPQRPAANVLVLLSNQVALITNKVEALKTPVGLITKIDLSTNRHRASAKIEITKPATAVEQVVLTIKARDYTNGKRVDEFCKAIASHPYFATRLYKGEGEGIRLRERGIQPEFDQLDSLSPAKPYIPFVIECRYRDTARANE